MDKMLPPSKDITNKLLLDKAIKFGIDKNTAEVLLKDNQQKTLKKMIDKRIQIKTDEMLKKSNRIFKKIDRNSKSNAKKALLLRNQNFELKVLKDYFREEAKKLDKRGPPIPIPNRLLTSDEIKSIEENAQRNLKRYFLDVERGVHHLPDRVSSGVSINDHGYDPSSESSADQGFKRKSKTRKNKRSKTRKNKRSKTRKNKRSKKKSKRRSRR